MEPPKGNGDKSGGSWECWGVAGACFVPPPSRPSGTGSAAQEEGDKGTGSSADGGDRSVAQGSGGQGWTAWATQQVASAGSRVSGGVRYYCTPKQKKE